MKRSVVLGIAAGLVVIVVAWFFLIYSPKSKDLTKASNVLDAAQKQHDSLETQLAQLKHIAANQPAEAAKLASLSTAIPQTPDLAGFITAANQIATDTGVDWVSVSPSTPTASKTGGPTEIALNIQVNGLFDQVYDYLKALEGMDRIVVVSNVMLAPGGSGATTGAAVTPAAPTASTPNAGAEPLLNLTIQGTMYSQAPPTGTGTTAPGAPGGTAPAPGTPPTTTAPATAGKSQGVS